MPAQTYSGRAESPASQLHACVVLPHLRPSCLTTEPFIHLCSTHLKKEASKKISMGQEQVKERESLEGRRWGNRTHGCWHPWEGCWDIMERAEGSSRR